MSHLRRNSGQIVITAILAVLALITFVPILTLINLSFKDTYQFGANPMGITLPLALENYSLAWKFMRDPLWHNVVIGLVVDCRQFGDGGIDRLCLCALRSSRAATCSSSPSC